MENNKMIEMARILVAHSLEVKPDQWIMLAGGVPAIPLINEIAKQILQAGAQYDLVLDSDILSRTYLEEATHDQLKMVSSADRYRFEHIDGIIYVAAVENTRYLSGIDPERQKQNSMARNELLKIRNRRVEKGQMNWVYTEFPCVAYAQDADMSLEVFENFVYSACYADSPGGVERCRYEYQQDDQYAAMMNDHDVLTVRGPNVDLSLSVKGRKFINTAGRRNIPDGEIFTGPVESSVNGWIRFSFPAIYGGREVDKIEFQFKDGLVVSATAAKNNDFLQAMLGTDSGARFLGEFAIGTNYRIDRFTKRILYDEKMGGTIHLAIGNGYPETGSRNVSAIHWDFICDMHQESEIRADGEVVYCEGKFLH